MKYFFLTILILCCQLYAVSVLHVGDVSHSPTKAAISGDIVGTVKTSLSGVNFASYDVLYIDEHASAAMFSGYEASIRSAMNAGTLGLVAEYCPVDILNNIFGISLVSATAGTPSVTALGASHSIITGSGLSGGAAMTNAANLDGSKRSFTSASVSGSYSRLITDSNGNVYAFSGTYGLGRFFILGNEAMESTPTQNEKNIIHNAVMYTMAPDVTANLSASNTNFGNVRVGTSETATVTVTNTGTSGSTLTGTIGAASGTEFSPVSGTQSFTLGQNQNSTRTFTYTPDARGADSTTITLNSNAGNTTRTLTGTGVSPVYSSSVAPDSLIDFGTVEPYSSNEYVLRIQNTTPDSDLGNLTNMTLLSATLSGIDASWFSIENFTPGIVLGKNGYIDLVLRANNPEWRFSYRYATLTIVTDENAAFGATGNTYTYNLTAYMVPEPSTFLFLSILFIFFAFYYKKI